MNIADPYSERVRAFMQATQARPQLAQQFDRVSACVAGNYVSQLTGSV